jgi:hypothetical protein
MKFSAAHYASTSDVPERQRLDYWASTFGAVWGEVDLFKSGSAEFHGALKSFRLHHSASTGFPSMEWDSGACAVPRLRFFQ